MKKPRQLSFEKRTVFINLIMEAFFVIAQTFEKEGLLIGVTDTPEAMIKGTKLWLYRPFSRVVRGYKAYLIVRDYIQLNEKEILGQIKYNSQRLKGLLRKDWEKLWS